MSLTLENVGGQWSLTFPTGETAVDETIAAAGHEPNGYFWEGLVLSSWPTETERLEFDSEAGMFAAYGERADLEALRDLLRGAMGDPAVVRRLIDHAEAAGFEFDD